MTKLHRYLSSSLDSAEDHILAQMELFIVIVAVIAVVAALFLLLLLQIRIKKHSLDNSVNTATCETSVAEIADVDSNDPYCKTGPPPYIEGTVGNILYTVHKKSKFDNSLFSFFTVLFFLSLLCYGLD